MSLEELIEILQNIKTRIGNCEVMLARGIFDKFYESIATVEVVEVGESSHSPEYDTTKIVVLKPFS